MSYGKNLAKWLDAWLSKNVNGIGCELWNEDSDYIELNFFSEQGEGRFSVREDIGTSTLYKRDKKSLFDQFLDCAEDWNEDGAFELPLVTEDFFNEIIGKTKRMATTKSKTKVTNKKKLLLLEQI